MIEKQKILFIQKLGEEEFETESLWCIKEGNNYIIDNIPFIAKRISLGDTILAEYDADEEAYYFDDFVAISGNSTVRLYFIDENLIDYTRKQLEEYGCESEGFLSRKMLAVNVPVQKSYVPVKAYLEEGEKNNKWQYEESCLAHEY